MTLAVAELSLAEAVSPTAVPLAAAFALVVDLEDVLLDDEAFLVDEVVDFLATGWSIMLAAPGVKLVVQYQLPLASAQATPSAAVL